MSRTNFPRAVHSPSRSARPTPPGGLRITGRIHGSLAASFSNT